MNLLHFSFNLNTVPYSISVISLILQPACSFICQQFLSHRSHPYVLFTACTVGGSLTGSSGFISSPNFPNNYPQGSRCMWNITVPSGYMIRVSFHRFTLDSSPALDRVTITNVASGDGSQVLQLFGSFPPYPVYSVGSFTQLIFTSVTGQYSGFNATYTAITSGERLSSMETPIIKS